MADMILTERLFIGHLRLGTARRNNRPGRRKKLSIIWSKSAAEDWWPSNVHQKSAPIVECAESHVALLKSRTEGEKNANYSSMGQKEMLKFAFHNFLIAYSCNAI